MAGRDLDPLFEAVVDATEESVLNSMLMAPTVVGRRGNTLYGLDADVVRGLIGDARSTD
jgi:D-aminopeptidase